MKYIYLTILAFSLTLISIFETNAQGFTFTRVGGDTTFTDSGSVRAYAHFKNTGSNGIRVRFERVMNHMPNGTWSSSICTEGFCYAPFVDIAPPIGDSAIFCLPNVEHEMDITMICPNNGTAHVRIKMYNDANPSLFIERDFFIVADIVGIRNISSVADKFAMSQNYPNPFNPVTKINFSIPKNEFVTLKVYDILGHEVANLVNQNLTSGQYTVDFNTAEFNLASGVFYYKLTSGSFVDVKKMMLVK